MKTPTERWEQHCRRMRIWSFRALRRFLSGEDPVMWGDVQRRSFLREVELAYQEGYRDGALSKATVVLDLAKL